METKQGTQMLRFLKALGKSASRSQPASPAGTPIQFNAYLNNPWVKVNHDFSEGAEILIAQNPDLALAGINAAQHAAALSLFYSLKRLACRQENGKLRRTMLGIGRFTPDSGPAAGSLPVLQQPIDLAFTNKGQAIRAVCRGSLSLNPALLAQIPLMTPAQLEKARDFAAQHAGKLTGQTDIVEFLTDFHNIVTVGDSNLLQTAYNPFIYDSDPSALYDTFLTDLLESGNPALAATALNPDRLTLDKDDYAHLTVGEAALRRLEAEGLALIQDMSGSRPQEILDDVVRSYMSENRSVLILSPVRHLLSELESRLQPLFSPDPTIEAPTAEALEAARVRCRQSWDRVQKALSQVRKRLSLKKLSVKPKQQQLQPGLPPQTQDSAMRIYRMDGAGGNYWNRSAAPTRSDITALLHDFQALPASDVMRDKWCWKIIESTRYPRIRKTLMAILEDLAVYCDGLDSQSRIAARKPMDYGTALSEIREALDLFGDSETAPDRKLPRNSAWKAVSDAYTVNGSKPATKIDYQELQQYIQSQAAYDRLLASWDLVLPLSDYHLNEMSRSQIKQLLISLRRSMNWNAAVFEPLTARLNKAGFRWSDFFNTFNQLYVEKGFVRVLLDDVLPALLIHLQNMVSELALNESSPALVDDPLHPAVEPDTILNLEPLLQELLESKSARCTLSDLRIRAEHLGQLSFSNWTDFLSRPAAEQQYDLIIIPAAETLDLFGFLPFYCTERILLIGDSARAAHPSATEDSPALKEIKTSLLGEAALILSEKEDLFGNLVNLNIKPLKLTVDSSHPPTLSNIISSQTYGNELLPFVPPAGRLPGLLTLAVDNQLGHRAPDYDSTLNFVRSLLTNINQEGIELSVAVMEFNEPLHNKIFTPLFSEQLSRGFGNLTVSVVNPTDLTRRQYDTVILLDLSDRKQPLSRGMIEHRINAIINLPRRHLVYLYYADQPLNQLGSLLSSAQTSFGFRPAPISTVIEDVIDGIPPTAVYQLLQLENIAGQTVDLYIPNQSPAVLLSAETLGRFADRNAFVKWVLILHEQGIKPLVIRKPFRPKAIADELQYLLETPPLHFDPGTAVGMQALVRRTTSAWVSGNRTQQDHYRLPPLKAELNTPTPLISDPAAPENSLPESPKPAASKDSLWDELAEAGRTVDLLASLVDEGDPAPDSPFTESGTPDLLGGERRTPDLLIGENSTPDLLEIEKPRPSQAPEPLIHEEKAPADGNSVAMFNFSGIDLPSPPPAEHPMDNLNITSGQSEGGLLSTPTQPSPGREDPLLLSAEDTPIRGIDLFAETPSPAAAQPTAPAAFDLISWLEEKAFDYRDFRPDGKLWVADRRDVRNALRSLRSKGCTFTMNINSPDAPFSGAAWVLEE